MTVASTHLNISSLDGSAKLVKWIALTEGDTTPPVVELPEWGDRSVQVLGTFNGGTCLIEGSNDGVTWATLNDPQGNTLSFTATKIEQLLELTRYMRPRISAGTGVTLDVYMVLRRTSGMRT